MTPEQLMDLALAQARLAADLDEVPVGAVIACDGKVIASAHNRRERDRDPLAHAEMGAIAQAARRLGRWRLTGCTLAVTLEPCPMCAGAVVNARISRVVFGAYDPRAGAAGSVFSLLDSPALNHRPEVISGVSRDKAAYLLQHFFAQRRGRSRSC